jgi:poly-gamma-glutamate synthesis protein (capsule biosynthesis protein)
VSLVLPTAATLVLVAATGAVLSLSDETVAARPDPTVATVTGMVVDDTGAPISGATVWLDRTRVLSGPDGRFTVPREGAALVTASAPGHLPRTTTVDAGRVSRIALTGEASRTVSLRFGGDVMLGRRYYTGSDDTAPPLSRKAGSDDIARVLSGVKPLLEDADLSVVNLETALVENPWTDTDGRRPASVHPTKDLVITSSTKAARALKTSGVDVVSLSNNHSFDGLDQGLGSTIKSLDAAGVRHYGAGATVEAAWQPAIVTVKNQTMAFVGCTTVDGHAQTPSYVADGKHGGAAKCEPQRLESAVRAARNQAAYVVVSIHGGTEYRRSQTPEVRMLANVAHRAGARLVVGSHPHVVGGLMRRGDNVFIESLGNLAFDQEIWATLPSYLARVDVRGGATVAADIDPLVLDHYVPRPATGALAAAVHRLAAGWVDGGARLDQGRAAVSMGEPPVTGAPALPRSTVRLAAGEVRRLGTGWWVVPADDLGSHGQVGTDQLFGSGNFEPEAVGTSDAGPLWTLGKYGRVTTDASCSPSGGQGLLLARTPLSQETAVATTRHRVPAAQGQKMTLTAKVRQASAGSRLEVHWYTDLAGPSTSSSRVDVPAGSWDRGSCLSVLLKVVAPSKAVAAQVFVVLDPPNGGQTVRRLAVDDLMLVDWAPKGKSGRRYDVVGGLTTGSVAVAADDSTTARTSPLVP